MLKHAQLEKQQTIIDQWAEKEAKLKQIREIDLRQEQRYENGQSRVKKPVSLMTEGG